jgi:hypothetical protein
MYHQAKLLLQQAGMNVARSKYWLSYFRGLYPLVRQNHIETYVLQLDTTHSQRYRQKECAYKKIGRGT